jgi:hypothetical protein
MDTKELEEARKIFETEDWKSFIAKLRSQGSIEERVAGHHRRCGAHSNIPACCVEFYIHVWQLRKIPKSFIGSAYRFLIDSLYPKGKRPQYVPCPNCLITRHSQPLYECTWKVESVRVGECEPTGEVKGFS